MKVVSTMSFKMQKNIPLAPHTTLKVGGNAEFFCVVTDEATLAEAVQFANKEALPITVIGGGSNVLINDDGITGLVIKNEIQGQEESHEGDAVFMTVGAGEVFDDFVARTVEKGYWGLENLSHIPGTVGATPIQNVGAYGVEVSGLITEVAVYDMVLEEHTVLKNEECAFGYRDSVFKQPEGKKFVVTRVTYRLSTAPKPQLLYKDLVAVFEERDATQQEIRDAVIAIRSKKFPDWHHVGTAGSFFKNPIITNVAYASLKEKYSELPGFPVGTAYVKIPLGYVLDKILGLKGVHEGSVGTYQGQALVLINEGGATAAEITSFAESIVQKVYDTCGITVEWEVTRL